MLLELIKQASLKVHYSCQSNAEYLIMSIIWILWTQTLTFTSTNDRLPEVAILIRIFVQFQIETCFLIFSFRT